jgi:ankyrin repeat protein
MRKTITILLTLICLTFCGFGQDNNEKLYKAIVKGDSSLVKQLLNNKADPNYIKAEGPWMKVNMLITAVNNENINIVKMLIINKADVKWKDGFKTTALMYAASTGNKEIVVLLLDNGADINDNDGQGNTVLSAAKESKNKELIEFIEGKLKEKK